MISGEASTQAIPAAVRFRSIVLDCPDPSALAEFYAALLDAQADTSDRSWCTVHLPNSVRIAFQRVDRYVAPEWPDGVPQQLHLDLTVDNLEAATERARALGAAELSGITEEPGDIFRVFADPAGHPFCLCQDRV